MHCTGGWSEGWIGMGVLAGIVKCQRYQSSFIREDDCVVIDREHLLDTHAVQYCEGRVDNTVSTGTGLGYSYGTHADLREILAQTRHDTTHPPYRRRRCAYLSLSVCDAKHSS
jgi:hypothetical protein